MPYDKENAHRRGKKKKMAFAATICGFIVAINVYAVLKPIFRCPSMNSPYTAPVIFNYSNPRTDVYEIVGDVRIHGGSSTIFIASTGKEASWFDSRTIKPHPRKYDPIAMRAISDFKILTGPSDSLPRCSRTLDIPAVLASTGGHTTNHFHAISDFILPLYATSQHFNRNVIFLVSDLKPALLSKYKEPLETLSEYDVIDIDKIQETLCFSRLTIGLRNDPVDLNVDKTHSSGLSTRNFTAFMRRVYSLERDTVHDREGRRPRMLVVSRSTTRRLTNQQELADMAQGLGFDAVVHEFGRNVTAIAQVVNTFDVMVGIHGAGLTNMVFLPEDAVEIQITPMGLDNYAKDCYGDPPVEMGLKYLEYKVSLNESSLLGKYPPDSEIYKNPGRFCWLHGFEVCKKMFMDNQDVNLDLGRFRKTLFKALELLAA